MKILQIHNHYREGGGEDTVVARESSLLRNAGHEVIEFRATNAAETIKAATSLLASPWNVAAARRVTSAIAESNPDIAHVHNTWWTLTPSILSSLKKVRLPVVVTLHNYRLICSNGQLFRDGHPCEDCVGTHPWRGVRHRCYRNATVPSIMAAGTLALNRRLGSWDSVRSFFVLTEFARELLVAGGLPPSKLRIKPNFVEDPGTRAAPPSQSPFVLYVGRISDEKGVRSLLAAWSSSSLNDLELVLVGDGPAREEFEAADLPGVQFLGSRTPNEVRRLMLSARALAFPSTLYEGQPMVLLEGLACGLPIIASNTGGVPETIADPTAGILVPPGDPSSWSSALERLRDANWVDEASSAGRAVFEGKYTPEVGLQALLVEYRRAVSLRA